MLPHFKVYTRLGVSPIHGIGVFAVTDIPAGTPLFEFDNTEMIWIESDQLKNLTPKQELFYKDFCVAKDGKLGCPVNFNQLTMAWYMNHSDNPNVEPDKEYNFIAKRAIKDGEELTIDYNSFI